MQMNVIQQPQQWFWVRRVFPWLDEDQVDWLYNKVDSMWVTDTSQRLQAEQEVYKKMIPYIEKKKVEIWRADVNNEKTYKAEKEKDPVKKKQLANEVKYSEVAALVKKKEGFRPSDPDDVVMDAWIKDNPSAVEWLNKYFEYGDDRVLLYTGLRKPEARDLRGDREGKDFFGNMLADLPQTSMNLMSGIANLWMKPVEFLGNAIWGKVEEYTDEQGAILDQNRMQMEAQWDTAKQIIQEKLGVNPNSTASSVWAGVTETVPSLIAGWPLRVWAWLARRMLIWAWEWAMYALWVDWEIDKEDWLPIAMGVWGETIWRWVTASKNLYKKLLAMGKRSKVDDLTSNALLKVWADDFARIKQVGDNSLTSRANPSILDDYVKTLNDDVTKYIRDPLKKVGEQLWTIRRSMTAKGKNFQVNATEALRKWDEVVEDVYSTVVKDVKRGKSKAVKDVKGGKSKAVNLAWGTNKFVGKQADLLMDLRKDIKAVKSADDIDNIFDKLNSAYDEYLATIKKWRDKQFMAKVWEIREVLDQQLDDFMGSGYKQLRQEYSRLKDLDESFKYLTTKKQPWGANEYLTTSRVKKLFWEDAEAVRNELLKLQEITGKDYISLAEVARFIGKNIKEESYNIFESLFSGVPRTQNIAAQTLSLTDKLSKWIGRKLVWPSMKIAEDIARTAENLPEPKKIEILNKLDDVMNALDQVSDLSETEKLNIIKKAFSKVK